MAKEVLLMADVKDLGSEGDVVSVADGYARNYLLPKRLAMEVSDNNLLVVEKEKKVYEAKMAQEKEAAEVVAGAIGAVKLGFRRKVHGESEDLYGSVSLSDIAEALEEKGFKLEKKKFLMDEPLKTLGEFTISVKLHSEVIASFPVTIEKEVEEQQ